MQHTKQAALEGVGERVRHKNCFFSYCLTSNKNHTSVEICREHNYHVQVRKVLNIAENLYGQLPFSVGFLLGHSHVPCMGMAS